MKPAKNVTLEDGSVTRLMEICTGCQNCVIACSYHHKKAFSRAMSSLEVTRLKDFENEIKVHMTDGDHIACDRCTDSQEPLCMKYCPSVAKAELADFLREAWRELDHA